MKFILLLLLALIEYFSVRGESIQPLLHPAAMDSLSANTQMGTHRAALQDGFAAIESAKATHDTVDLAVFYLNVGRVYEELHQLPEALDYYTKGYAKKGNISTKT